MTFIVDPSSNALGTGILVNTIVANGEPLQQDSLSQVTILNEQNAHETATVSVSLTTSQVDHLQDTTVKFTYGPRLGLATFYGYIQEIAPSRNYQENLMYDLHCIGSTRPLQQSSQPRWYAKKTIPHVISDIVTKQHLGIQMEHSDFQFPTLAQTNESDWEFVVTLAKLAGFAVFNYQGVIRVVSPLRILNESGPSIRLIKGDEVLDKSRALLDFQPTAYSKKKPKYTKPAFGYFNNTKPAVTHQPTTNYRFRSDVPVVDKTMAEFYLKAWDSNCDNWVQKATARIQGNAKLQSGQVVSIQISGSSVIQHDFDGLWLIRSIKHDLTAGSFQTSLSLIRDTKQRLSNIDTKPWTQTPQGHPQLTQQSADANWQSTWKSPVYISANIVAATPKIPTNPVWTD